METPRAPRTTGAQTRVGKRADSVSLDISTVGMTDEESLLGRIVDYGEARRRRRRPRFLYVYFGGEGKLDGLNLDDDDELARRSGRRTRRRRRRRRRGTHGADFPGSAARPGEAVHPQRVGFGRR